jgi:hypothetical protein
VSSQSGSDEVRVCYCDEYNYRVAEVLKHLPPDIRLPYGLMIALHNLRKVYERANNVTTK